MLDPHSSSWEEDDRRVKQRQARTSTASPVRRAAAELSDCAHAAGTVRRVRTLPLFRLGGVAGIGAELSVTIDMAIQAPCGRHRVISKQSPLVAPRPVESRSCFAYQDQNRSNARLSEPDRGIAWGVHMNDWIRRLGLLTAASWLAVAPASAQTVEQFYRGKTM